MSMFRPTNWLRVLKIKGVLLKLCFAPAIVKDQSVFLRFFSYCIPYRFKANDTRGQVIRLSFEALGPVFIKFGQMLSTRPDLIPIDIIEELEKLQDRVPPFPSKIAIQIIEQTLQSTISQLFKEFEETPLASASVAQVHGAKLADGSEVVVKILRPNIVTIIKKDIAILYGLARLIERSWSQGRRLHPVALVAEFESTIFDELDLMREAGSASQLRRNFLNSPMMYVPKIYWNYVAKNILVLERISGVRISDVPTLLSHHTNMKKLAEYGVEIFFTQVFRDNFFHADMHPGNLFVDITDPENPKYIGVDFGIMGSLSAFDQHYLAENLLAFFDRDYQRVAMLHVESGWVPPNTRVEQMEAAIRTVCEPIFERPLQEISFGKLLLQLFITAERFNMEIQPQLMLLQKTLLSIEGLGRQLYPQLNLWETAKPFMNKWIKEKYGIKNLIKVMGQDWPDIRDKLIPAPKIALSLLHQLHHHWLQKPLCEKKYEKTHYPKKKALLNGMGIGLIGAVLFSKGFNILNLPSLNFSELLILGGVFLLIGFLIPSNLSRETKT